MGPDSAILKSWRDHLPPCSSSLVKVSQVANNKHESPHFVSGGFNWYVLKPKNYTSFITITKKCCNLLKKKKMKSGDWLFTLKETKKRSMEVDLFQCMWNVSHPHHLPWMCLLISLSLSLTRKRTSTSQFKVRMHVPLSLSLYIYE